MCFSIDDSRLPDVALSALTQTSMAGKEDKMYCSDGTGRDILFWAGCAASSATLFALGLRHPLVVHGRQQELVDSQIPHLQYSDV